MSAIGGGPVDPGARPPESATRVVLVRHGQTPWNAAGRWQGHADPPLSTLGRVQAAELARALTLAEDPERVGEGEPSWHHILTSDLARARETAEILAQSLALPIAVDARLRELDVGQWSGLTRTEIESRDAADLAAFESGDPSVRPGQGESRAALRDRVLDCFAEYATRWAGQRFLLVAHLGVIRALVPGSEPTNAERLEVIAEEVLSDLPTGVRPGPTGPL